MRQKLSKKQTYAFDTLDAESTQVLLYGGAKGGGKSVFGCIWLFMKCLEVIKKNNLKPIKYPIPVGFMGRKQSVDFNDTTLETWKAFIPSEGYELKSGDKEIIVRRTVKIQYGGFDNKETVKKFNSAEYGYAFIDQAEEITRDDYGLLRGTLRRKINDIPIPYKVLLTANPADCWLKDDFITGGSEENKFIQALPSDNPFLPDGYVDNLKEAFKHRPELIEAYVYGSWDAISGFDLVIKPSWVLSAVNRDLRVEDKRTAIGADIARFGDDETVIYVYRGKEIVDSVIYGQKSTMETAGHIATLYRKYNCSLAGIDGVGVGGGVVDRLREIGIKVLDIQSGQKPSTEPKEIKYVNQKAEMWWEGAQVFYDEAVSIPDDTKLKRQLSGVKYSIDSRGRIKLEPKEKVKERMAGESYDRAEAAIIGLYTLKHVPINYYKQRQQRWKPKPKNKYGWN